jgi:DNA repair exonuclease SbcCD nuclease subunit/energy-coupling factor transporter ATP-binding protein EcfA2
MISERKWQRHLKLILTADIHIHPYRTFSTLTGGIPDRLLIYEDLAKDIVKIGEDAGAEGIILAGDIVTSEVMSPPVSHVLSNFLTTITSSYEATFMIDGNHDIDSNVSLEYSSSLEPFTKLPGVYYNKKDTVVEYKGIKIYLFNYKEDEKSRFSPTLDADILVAHGLVSGVTSPKGFMFRKGFNVDDLASRYKFSVIGDIHKAELLKDRVLIPGVPIQADFRDSSTTGVWLLETDDWTATYIPIDSDKYHKFITSDEDNIKSSSTVHVRKKSLPKVKLTRDGVKSVGKTVHELFNAIVDSSTREDKEEVRSLGTDILLKSNSNISSNVTNKYYLKSIEMEGILSVTEKIKLEVTDGSLLIVGDNGVGKSSILAALGWLLFDEVPASMLYKGSQKMYKDEIVNDNSKEAVVTATFLVDGGSEVTMTRRKSKDGKSTIDTEVELDKDGFFNFVYFDAQNRVTLLGGSTPTVQEDYISKIGDLEIIQEAKTLCNSYKSQTMKDIDLMEVNLNSVSSQLSQFSAVEKEIESKIPSYSTVPDKTKLKEHLLYEYSISHGGTPYSEEDSKLHEEYSRAYSTSQSKYYELKDYIIGLKTDTTCKCCGQELPKDSIDYKVSSAVDKMKNLSVELTKLPDLIKNTEDAYNFSKTLEIVSYFESTLSIIQSSKDSVLSTNTELNKKKDTLDKYKYLRDVFSTQLPAAAMKSVADEINTNLDTMLSSSNVKVHINTFNYNKSGSISPGLLIEGSFNNEPLRRYVRLSGAQKRICDLALMVCLNNMYLDSMGGLSILLFDEVFSYLGDNLAEVALETLEYSKADLRLIVTHDLRLIPHFENKCIVYSENGTKLKES